MDPIRFHRAPPAPRRSPRRPCARPLSLASSSAAVAALALGCASHAPRELVPADELALLRSVRVEALQLEYSAADEAGEPARRFDASDGLDERELAALALALHPKLRARRADLGVAEAGLVAAGRLPNPEFGVLVRPGIDGANGTSLGLEALFSLLRPDERPARRALARSELGIARAELAADELRVVGDVRRARLARFAAADALRLLEQELALRDEAVALVKRQRELGEASEIALALVELDRAQVRREARAARAELERARAALSSAAGLPVELELHLAGEGEVGTVSLAPDIDDAELDRRLLDGQPELRLHAAAYERSEQELRLACARSAPSLALGPSYERDLDGGAGLGLGASLEIPLFDRGPIDALRAARETARAEYDAALHEARARAFAAREELRRTRAEVELGARELEPLVRRTEALFEGALRARELSVFEWLSVRSRAIQARRELLEASTRHARALVDLEAATGTPFVALLRRSGAEKGQ